MTDLPGVSSWMTRNLDWSHVRQSEIDFRKVPWHGCGPWLSRNDNDGPLRQVETMMWFEVSNCIYVIGENQPLPPRGLNWGRKKRMTGLVESTSACVKTRKTTTTQSIHVSYNYTYHSKKTYIYVNNQMWANMPYMDRWRQTAQGSQHLLVAPGDAGMLSVVEMSGHVTFDHSFLRKRVGPFTRVQKEKSGGRQRSISWWRGFWNWWWQWALTSVWLSMSFFRIVFRVNFMLYHLLETSWIVRKWNKLSLFWDKYKNPRSKMIPWKMRV